MEITAAQIAERITAKYRIRYDIVTGRFIMNLNGSDCMVPVEHVSKLIDEETTLISREIVQDALIRDHEIMYDPNTDRFKVTLKQGGKRVKRIMSREEFKRFFDTRLKSLGAL